MLLTCLCTPIFINTSVVFVRLYWFEKRFQNVVLEARSLRRTKTRSRTKSEARADQVRDVGQEEAGVGDRAIVVLRSANGLAKGKKIEDEAEFKLGIEHDSSDSSSPGHTAVGPDSFALSPTEKADAPFHRDIKFADEKDDVVADLDRLPERISKEQNIAFVENQRNPQDKGTLRIPGPRDFDRGFVPERIDESEEQLGKEASNEEAESPAARRTRSHSVPPNELNQDDHPFKQHITFDAANNHHSRPHTGPSAYKKAEYSDAEPTASSMHLRNRSRSKTLGSFMSKSKTEEKDPMPYLSWTPTVGRNSAFIDLTEAQREELGGIEYRSLKLLALILVTYYVGFHLLGSVCLIPWIVRDRRYASIVEQGGVNAVWW
jgi:hypothetical protein